MKLNEAKEILKQQGYLLETNMKNDYDFDVLEELEVGDSLNNYYMLYTTTVKCNIYPAEPEIGITSAEYDYDFDEYPIIVYAASEPVDIDDNRKYSYNDVIFNGCNNKEIALKNVDFDKAKEFTKTALGKRMQKAAIDDLEKKCDDGDYFNDELQKEIDRCYPEPPDADPWED